MVAADLQLVYQASTEAEALRSPGAISNQVGQEVPGHLPYLAGKLGPRQADV